jgi:hypothetical protein
MTLATIRYPILRAYRRFQDQGGPRLGDFLGWRIVCILTGVALSALGPSAGVSPWLSGFGVGLGAGALLKETVNAWRVMRNWPTVAEVVDWQRVDALLKDEGHSSPVT